MPVFVSTFLQRERFAENKISRRCGAKVEGSAHALGCPGAVANASRSHVLLARGLAARLRLAAIDAAGEAVDQPHVLVVRAIEADMRPVNPLISVDGKIATAIIAAPT